MVVGLAGHVVAMGQGPAAMLMSGGDAPVGRGNMPTSQGVIHGAAGLVMLAGVWMATGREPGCKGKRGQLVTTVRCGGDCGDGDVGCVVHDADGGLSHGRITAIGYLVMLVLLTQGIMAALLGHYMGRRGGATAG